MPKCHRCRHQEEIDKLEAERARLANICANCRGPCENGDHEGRCWVSFDAAQESQNILRPASDYQPHQPSDELHLKALTDEARDAALAVIRAFADLTPVEAFIVTSMMHRRSLKEISKELGISKQLLWIKWKRLVHHAPIWYEIRTGFIGVRKGGAKRRDFARINGAIIEHARTELGVASPQDAPPPSDTPPPSTPSDAPTPTPPPQD